MAEFRTTIYNLTRARKDFTIVQLAALLRIAEMKKQDARKFAALVTFLGVAKSTASRAVSRLCGDGLIKRVTDPTDHRTCWFDMTDEGSAMARHIAGGAKEASP